MADPVTAAIGAIIMIGYMVIRLDAIVALSQAEPPGPQQADAAITEPSKPSRRDRRGAGEPAAAHVAMLGSTDADEEKFRLPSRARDLNRSTARIPTA
jgi:hypothetical protein